MLGFREPLFRFQASPWWLSAAEEPSRNVGAPGSGLFPDRCGTLASEGGLSGGCGQNRDCCTSLPGYSFNYPAYIDNSVFRDEFSVPQWGKSDKKE
jgi:hypothetical protein